MVSPSHTGQHQHSVVPALETTSNSGALSENTRTHDDTSPLASPSCTALRRHHTPFPITASRRNPPPPHARHILSVYLLGEFGTEIVQVLKQHQRTTSTLAREAVHGALLQSHTTARIVDAPYEYVRLCGTALAWEAGPDPRSPTSAVIAHCYTVPSSCKALMSRFSTCQ